MRSVYKYGSAALCAAISTTAFSDELSSNPFFKDSTTQIVNRNYYYNRDLRDTPSAGQNYRAEWAQGLIGTFTSGFTPGTVGVGLDAMGMYGLKLDSSSDRIGTGLLPSSGNHVAGVDHPADDFSKAGMTLKLKVSNTVLRYGDQLLNLPVFATGDSRLLPQTVEGLYLSSKEIPDLRIDVAHLTSLTAYAQSAHDGSPMTETDLAGVTYDFTSGLKGAAYASDVKDYWRKKYLGLTWVKPIDDQQSVNMDFHWYGQKSTGSERGGDIDSNAYSVKGTYSYNAQKLTLAYQLMTGKGGYVFYTDGGNTDYMANYVTYGEFTKEDERSWQARYDYNFVALGVPGLSFMTRYVRGDNIKRPNDASEQKEWERDTDFAYVVQGGPLKNLSFRARQASYRASFGGDLDEFRLMTQYPINL